MIDNPTPELASALRRLLDDHDYRPARLRERFGSSALPDADSHRRLLHVTREVSAENLAVRLFLLGLSAPASLLRELFPGEVVDALIAGGILGAAADRLRSTVAVTAVGDLLFASDATYRLGTADAAEFVLPAATPASEFLANTTLRRSVGTTLDLGCGCGVQALLAAEHSDSVVAADTSEAALRYTAFNAELNAIDNVATARGDFFSAVGDQRFDRIVCNPPFVIGPQREYVYRDNPGQLDELCAALTRDAVGHLEPDGILQLLFESVEIADEAWEQRIRSWVHGLDADAWILQGVPVSPAAYVARRSMDVGGTDNAADDYAPWLEYFREHSVTAIHAGMLLLRRRESPGWVHFHNSPSAVDGDVAAVVERGLAACELLAENDDDALLGMHLRLADDLRLQQDLARRDDAWTPAACTLRLDGGLPMDAEVDAPIVGFLTLMSSERTLGENIDAFAAQAGADATRLRDELLPIVTLFIRRGFIIAVGD